eukprot:363316-Chlamydomonas_euryale.AAC.12
MEPSAEVVAGAVVVMVGFYTARVGACPASARVTHSPCGRIPSERRAESTRCNHVQALGSPNSQLSHRCDTTHHRLTGLAASGQSGATAAPGPARETAPGRTRHPLQQHG